jgi:predicted TIM-barrel fold metal-dependent hydrolase
MDEVPLAAWDAVARLEYMDSVGIWAQVMYPNVGGFGNASFLQIDDAALRLDCVRAYNDWLLEWCSEDSRRLIPVMATPFWDIEAIPAEIERCAALGHRGILFTGEPQRFGLPYFGDPHWDPLWSAAQDSGLSISMHVGSGDLEAHRADERRLAHGYKATSVRAYVAVTLENGIQLADLLLSGVLPRYPGLRFVSVESGAGWVPFMLELVDHSFEYLKVWEERPVFTRKPSEDFRDQISVCYVFERLAPQNLVESVGADNLLFETDYPHPGCLFGDIEETVAASLEGQRDDVRRKLLWENAAKLYAVESPQAATVA